MVINTSIKVRNYKCFGDTTQGFEKIYPINIIIGKNNSGKSSLIDLIDYVISPKEDFIKTGRDGVPSQAVITLKLTEETIKKIPSSASGGGIPGANHYEYAKTLLGSEISYSMDPKRNKEVLHWEKKPINSFLEYKKSILNNIPDILPSTKFKRINAERDIKPEGSDYSKIIVRENGEGATNVIKQIVSLAQYDTRIIKKVLLAELNKVISPDIKFSDIHPQEVTNGMWEIYLEDSEKGLIPLSKMGSGIKTILLVLIDLIVMPEFEKTGKDGITYGFEELENNLHPSMQRRLFNYISEYSKKNNVYFFITTHSSIVIDLFKSNENAQILHVQNQGNHSEVTNVLGRRDGVNVLKDLDFKASDLLLSNGVIWVEGPSDAIYLEILLYLFFKDKKIEKGYNYSIQCLSTAIWKHAGFEDFDWEKIGLETQNKIIALAKLNHNHLLVIDRDNNYEDKKPSEWASFQNGTGKNKAKLIHESMIFSGHKEADLIDNNGCSINGGIFFWINEGTFESYLEYFVSNKGKSHFENFFDLKKARGYFEKKREGSNSSKPKVELANDIAKFCFDNDLSLEDIAPINSSLNDKLERLYITLKQWN